ncbi:hypothetical protein I6M86_05725 [Citrobacter cronae]|uniref:hypothetical protein n=1 Tax=Citrobacter freundii complex TaxID=1344959 RepID=UPI00136F7748|nr:MULTISPECIES: hypothetical protein [Citrobacter]MBJ8376044.1 hypothetical protein [Citrobacter cronae]MYL96003.1 hypothetical protein [Citrobacter werkmanii]
MKVFEVFSHLDSETHMVVSAEKAINTSLIEEAVKIDAIEQGTYYEAGNAYDIHAVPELVEVRMVSGTTYKLIASFDSFLQE